MIIKITFKLYLKIHLNFIFFCFELKLILSLFQGVRHKFPGATSSLFSY